MPFKNDPQPKRSYGHHGLSRKRAYKSWQNMIDRCYNPKNSAFQNYGGRGIVVCHRWKILENFYLDMGESPSSNHSIDRTDNNGNYEPGNCQWVMSGQQNKNTRSNVWLEFNGKKMILSDFAREYGIGVCTLWSRLYKYSWPIEKSLKTPARAKS